MQSYHSPQVIDGYRGFSVFYLGWIYFFLILFHQQITIFVPIKYNIILPTCIHPNAMNYDSITFPRLIHPRAKDAAPGLKTLKLRYCTSLPRSMWCCFYSFLFLVHRHGYCWIRRTKFAPRNWCAYRARSYGTSARSCPARSRRSSTRCRCGRTRMRSDRRPGCCIHRSCPSSGTSGRPSTNASRTK